MLAVARCGPARHAHRRAVRGNGGACRVWSHTVLPGVPSIQMMADADEGRHGGAAGVGAPACRRPLSLAAAGVSGAVLLATLWHYAGNAPAGPPVGRRGAALLQGEAGRGEGDRARGAYTCESRRTLPRWHARGACACACLARSRRGAES